ncbi:MAG: FAD-binding protein [Deltaproteobacteria bacterium]|nr:FAD-binding protein [Deltaproteobacteria bacterium]
MAERYDCIVVGAGPAGAAAALTLAKAGLSVIVFERGEYPGAKNLFGGILYTTVLAGLIPGFCDEAPLERHVSKRRYSFVTGDSEAAVDLSFDAFNKPPFNNSYTALRARFDRWFASKAEEAGAIVVAEAVVDELIMENGVAKGARVRMEGGTVYADAVILAEGANSLLAEKAGIRPRINAADYSLGVKEIISLPEGVIEDRFGLEAGAGTACEFFGEALGPGVEGGGFIYTNIDTLSVGIACPVSVLKEKMLKPNEMLDAFKLHPAVRKFLRGGRIEEYAAHLIPEGGYNAIGRLVGNGVLLAGDCAGFVNPSLYKEGTNLAMASGVMAAETVIEARATGDFSEAGLQGYLKRLNDSFVMQDLKRYRDVPATLHSSTGLFKEYPEAVMELLERHFTVSGESKAAMHKELRRILRGKVSLWRLAADALHLRNLIK